MLLAALMLAALTFALTQALHAISWATGLAQITVDNTFICFVPLIAIVGFTIHTDIFYRIALFVPGLTVAALIPILDDLAGRRHPFLLEAFVAWYGTWWWQLVLIVAATMTLGYWLSLKLK